MRGALIAAGCLFGFSGRFIACGFRTPGFLARFAGSTVFPLVVSFVILTSIVFALGGFLNSIFAKKFDDISIFPTFILTPLTYLGGVFYSIENLPPLWYKLSKLNPVLYMVNGFRYGFYGFSDVNVFVSFMILVVFAVILTIVNLILLARGTGLKT